MDRKPLRLTLDSGERIDDDERVNRSPKEGTMNDSEMGSAEVSNDPQVQARLQTWLEENARAEGGIGGDLRSPHYWLGVLAQAVRGAVDELERVERPMKPREVARTLTRVLREFESSPAVHSERVIVAYAIVDALDECYAIRSDRLTGEVARGQAVDYLFGAESSGHPAAGGWVAKRLPFALIMVTAEEREAYLEEGTPVLDREP